MNSRFLFQKLLQEVLFLGFCILSVAALTVRGGTEVDEVSRLPAIKPDYSGITVPPNIAPLNFFIEEPGRRFRAEIVSANGELIEVTSRSGSIQIPKGEWRRLLGQNSGQLLRIGVSAQNTNGHWTRFQVITNAISADRIDGYLAYRRLHPQFSMFGSGTIGIFQRNLETFEESPILELKDRTDESGHCVNCHTFLNRNPDTFTLHLRGADGKAMLLVKDGLVSKVDLTAGYMSWHPSGRLLAFSRNKLSLFFHSIGETRDVYDANSDLGIYRVDSNTVVSPAPISLPDRQENWPMWSADGRFLYFCSTAGAPLERFKEIRYDLNRVSYDLATDSWGAPETLLTAKETGRSLVEPRPSPDGRFLLFTMCDYGHFPIYQSNSVNCILDLQSRQHRRMDINSGQGETWHCWSSNGRWIVFSSKRLNRFLTRPFFAHIDENGMTGKPFVLPQEDPRFYDTFLKTFNVPEFVTGPVSGHFRDLFNAARGPVTLTPGGAAPPGKEQSDEAGPARR
jgi:hypothetical protein